ncbi:AAA family ATPase [Antrihabitans cavernicola]|uniref:ATP-binding protein n=1 Tax=Antrihabitans cavernicola TaxID=2495913 RepID=A0A5A7SBC9_9NOCA|nr:AAA family ATPase [Spelaeibacter cavernicola]KAA0022599.1 ATP-binding protein [Spelaeibacter cavernicola]
MPELLVLVNGLPGSGKSTLAAALADELDAQLLSKDVIKEALAACLRHPHSPTLGAIAMDTAWAMAAATSGVVVVDSWWFRPRDLHYAKAGIELVAADRAVEVWCDVSPEIALARFTGRNRPAIHGDKLVHDWDRWIDQAEPLGLTPVLRIDTTSPVDIADAAAQIRLQET